MSTLRVALPALACVLGATVPAAANPVAHAAKTQRCSISNNQEGTPGIDRLRATRTTCRTARAVAASLRRAARTGELERHPVARGRRFSCTFKRRESTESEYLATVCVNKTRKVTMRYYATGLLAP